jgi:hypothetical protein
MLKIKFFSLNFTISGQTRRVWTLSTKGLGTECPNSAGLPEDAYVFHAHVIVEIVTSMNHPKHLGASQTGRGESFFLSN